MSTINCSSDAGRNEGGAVVPHASKPLHRLAEARQEKGVTSRALACRLNTTVDQVNRQEQAANDLPLSALYQWAEALAVPVGELLAGGDSTLPLPRLGRQQAVELLATARTILQQAEKPSVRRMTETLIEQLVEMMPELKSAGVPPIAPRKRPYKEEPIVPRPLPDKFFIKPMEEH